MAKFTLVYEGVRGRPGSSMLSLLWAELWVTPCDNVDYIYVYTYIGVSNVRSPFSSLLYREEWSF